MSAEPPWPLKRYIEALVAGVDQAEPASAARLRAIVGDRSAVIAVDDESVLVCFVGLTLVVTEGGGPAHGYGFTDRRTVLDLLAARVEITEAVLNDRLQLTGTNDAIVRISQAIEILLDVSSRAPALQTLADRYRTESPVFEEFEEVIVRDSKAIRRREMALLGRLGLLPST